MELADLLFTKLWAVKLLGTVSQKPWKLFGPVKPFLVHLYLKTEHLKHLVWREPLFIIKNMWIKQLCNRKVPVWRKHCEDILKWMEAFTLLSSFGSPLPINLSARQCLSLYRSSWNRGHCLWPFGDCRFRHSYSSCNRDHPQVHWTFHSSGITGPLPPLHRRAVLKGYRCLQ